MSIKLKRKLRTKSVRALLGYSFFHFGQRIESAAAVLGKSVVQNLS